MSITNPFGSPICRKSFHTYRPSAFLSSTRRGFRSTRSILQDAFPNHYETLELEPGASPAHIKKQFYALSKKHHPDLHPSDPSASQRFVAISEAYHTLGTPEKRSKYDRDYSRIYSPQSSLSPRGSYSSHTAHRRSNAGGRPASGLSTRRTQFRGPPPSFYASGGYGAHSSKREEASSKPSHSSAHAQQQRPGTSPGSDPFMPRDPDLPYWDKQSHLKTHDALRQRREANFNGTTGLEEDSIGGSVIVNFFLVSGVLGFVLTVSAWFTHRSTANTEKRKPVRLKENG